jgi:hypothetical protein
MLAASTYYSWQGGLCQKDTPELRTSVRTGVHTSEAKNKNFDKDAHFVIDFTDPGGVLFIAVCLAALLADLFSLRTLIGLLKAARLRLRDVRRG